jgi:hypothetical protein
VPGPVIRRSIPLVKPTRYKPAFACAGTLAASVVLAFIANDRWLGIYAISPYLIAIWLIESVAFAVWRRKAGTVSEVRWFAAASFALTLLFLIGAASLRWIDGGMCDIGDKMLLVFAAFVIDFFLIVSTLIFF